MQLILVLSSQAQSTQGLSTVYTTHRCCKYSEIILFFLFAADLQMRRPSSVRYKCAGAWLLLTSFLLHLLLLNDAFYGCLCKTYI